MKTKTKSLFVTALSLFLISCTSPIKTYNQKYDDYAILSSDLTARIVKIDGVKYNPTSDSEFHLLPGKHSLSIRVTVYVTGGWFTLQEDIKISFTALKNHSYFADVFVDNIPTSVYGYDGIDIDGEDIYLWIEDLKSNNVVSGRRPRFLKNTNAIDKDEY